MSLFGLEFHGRQHDALNDAKAAGELFVYLNARILKIEAIERVLALDQNHGHIFMKLSGR